MADVEILGNGNPDGTSAVGASEKLSLFGDAEEKLTRKQTFKSQYLLQANFFLLKN